MNPREFEAALVEKCAAVAALNQRSAHDSQEANVFVVAAGLVRSAFPQAAERLKQAGEAYFSTHPGERLEAEEVVRRGWVLGLPRLRDTLHRKLGRSAS